MEESSRRSDIMKGVRNGAVKESVNTVADPLAESLKETFLKNFGSEDPIVDVLAGMGSKFIILLLFAETLGVLGEYSSIDDEKIVLLSRYFRKLAGEEIGEEGMKLFLKSLPSVSELFNNIKTEDIRYALGEKSDVYNTPLPSDVISEEAVKPKSLLDQLKNAEESVKEIE